MECGAVLHPSQDAWRHGGLNKSGWEVYRKLLQGSLTAQEMAAEAAVSVSTARRVLRRLGEAGLAERLPKGEWRAVLNDLDEAAALVGTAGAKDRQAIRHQQERDRFREQLPWAGTPSVINGRRARKRL